jgi:hypothetical protein
MTPFGNQLSRWTRRLPLGPVAPRLCRAVAFPTTRPHHDFVDVGVRVVGLAPALGWWMGAERQPPTTVGARTEYLERGAGR